MQLLRRLSRKLYGLLLFLGHGHFHMDNIIHLPSIIFIKFLLASANNTFLGPNYIDNLPEGWVPVYLDLFIEESDWNTILVYINGWPHYLVSAKDGCVGYDRTCTPLGSKNGEQCTRHSIRALPGMSLLIPETNIWGNITR
jgi:hypothetical protein